MSEPIRSAPCSPFACARPQVRSRSVSLRLGPFGLTYSTDRLLWSAGDGTDPSSPVSPLTDPPPVDPAPGVGAEAARAAAQGRPYTSPAPSPADLEAALRQARLWQAAQRQAAQERGQAQGATRTAGGATCAEGVDSAARAEGIRSNVGQAHVGQARSGQTAGGPLRNALRQASRAYQACAANFASPPPMLQAVA